MHLATGVQSGLQQIVLLQEAAEAPRRSSDPVHCPFRSHGIIGHARIVTTQKIQFIDR